MPYNTVALTVATLPNKLVRCFLDYSKSSGAQRYVLGARQMKLFKHKLAPERPIQKQQFRGGFDVLLRSHPLPLSVADG
jgi:hypothetical protein